MEKPTSKSTAGFEENFKKLEKLSQELQENKNNMHLKIMTNHIKRKKALPY